ncbi:uncharacterized protein G2W53_007456 [Senna tora]|uniref:Uncharacterized protein n=1 Tax=Senna tora TaxID=362788 RepID=A0A834X6F0_9FABA|nr:uncharacterized protein G2W53_007456 [Senna tora]
MDYGDKVGYATYEDTTLVFRKGDDDHIHQLKP